MHSPERDLGIHPGSRQDQGGIHEPGNCDHLCIREIDTERYQGSEGGIDDGDDGCGLGHFFTFFFFTGLGSGL